MMFYIFIKACEKYGFSYALSSYNGLSLVLRPAGTFENIEAKQGFYECNYFKLFWKAIMAMKDYRKTR